MSSIPRKIITAVRIATSAEYRRLARQAPSRAAIAPPPPVAIDRISDTGDGYVEINVGGLRFFEPATMDLEGLADIHREVFEPAHPHYYLFEECDIRPGDVVIDAGASEGFFTRFALDRGATVIAVEPWSVQAEALRRTFSAEVADGRVVVEQVALSDRPGETILEVDPVAPWGATVGHAYRATVSETVKLDTLDDVVDRNGGRCDFIKADVEGAEVAMFRGAGRTLARDRPRASIAVYHAPTNYLDIRKILQRSGRGYTVTGKGSYRRRGFTLPMMLHAWSGPVRS